MIDIFTVLVTFLLMTAVFSRTVILELKLPPANAEFKDAAAGIAAGGHGAQGRAAWSMIATPGRWRAFRTRTAAMTTMACRHYLQQVKTKFPDKTDATILLEPDTPYDIVVQVMDRMRVLEVNAGLDVVQYELFPDVSIGDAPVMAAAARADAAAPGAPARRHREAPRMSMSSRARFMLQHQLRHRVDGQLNLIPMIDILSRDGVVPAGVLDQRRGTAEQQGHRDSAVDLASSQPRQTVVVMLTKEDLFVQGERIASVAEIQATQGDIIEPLRAALKRPTLVGQEITEAGSGRARDHGHGRQVAAV